MFQSEVYLRSFRVRGWHLQKLAKGLGEGHEMTERRAAHRYDLSLPVIIRVPVDHVAAARNGKTRDISTRGLYFTINENVEAGSELDITLTLPAEITQGAEVFVRAQGKVVRVERKPAESDVHLGVAAVIERYDIIRGEPLKA